MNSGKSYDLMQLHCRSENHADCLQYVPLQIIRSIVFKHDLSRGSSVRVSICSCRLVSNRAYPVLLPLYDILWTLTPADREGDSYFEPLLTYTL
jgi:hypothetical protein